MKSILGVFLFFVLIAVAVWVFCLVWPRPRAPLKDWRPPSDPSK